MGLMGLKPRYFWNKTKDNRCESASAEWLVDELAKIEELRKSLPPEVFEGSTAHARYELYRQLLEQADQ